LTFTTRRKWRPQSEDFEAALDYELGRRKLNSRFLRNPIFWGALLGALLAFLFHLVENSSESAIKRLDEQRDKLYGIVLSASLINDVIWENFTYKYWNRLCPEEKNYIWPPNVKCLRNADVERWRTWMQTVFEPLNIKIENTIIANAPLLDIGTLPPKWRRFIQHTEAC
jgi:hypothetical protein